MRQSEGQILAEELAALGGASGGTGRLVGVVAKLMRNNVHEIDLRLPLPFDDAVGVVSDVLGAAGHPVETPPVGSASGGDESQGDRTIRVVADGGAGGLNPVVVTARVLGADEGSSEVWLRGAAKEGLIKQRAGEEVVVRLAALLATAAGATGAAGQGG
ncbi:hypothetical protein [Streptomyces sp. NPDC008150]|uniref:hypothetical protein n=1 Tax=Streptomyces sp. NPDC008150 TaxID=3364816 RepID=UPI0036F1703E